MTRLLAPQARALGRLLRATQPSLSAHAEVEAALPLWCSRCFLNLYVHAMPLRCVLALWDMLLQVAISPAMLHSTSNVGV